MKHYKSLAWMMAIAIASTTLTACSLDGNEPGEAHVTTDPVEKPRFTPVALARQKPARPVTHRTCSSPRTTSNGSTRTPVNCASAIRWSHCVRKSRCLLGLISISAASTSFPAEPPASVSSVARCLTTSCSAAERLTARSSTMAATISTTAIRCSSSTRTK